MINNANTCVCCGAIIPEGIQVCYSCYTDSENRKYIKNIRQNDENPRKSVKISIKDSFAKIKSSIIGRLQA